MKVQDAVKIARILNQSYASSPKKQNRDRRHHLFVDKFERLLKQEEKRNERNSA